MITPIARKALPSVVSGIPEVSVVVMRTSEKMALHIDDSNFNVIVTAIV